MDLGGRGYSLAAWGGCALIALGTAVMAFRGDWRATVILGLFLALSVGFVVVRSRLPALFDLLFVVASMANAAGYVWGLFHVVPFYDEVAHAYTTFAITLALGFLIFRSMTLAFSHHGWLFVVATASVGLSIGVLWEIFEYVTGIIGPLQDTITDLVADTVGALAGGMVAMLAIKFRAAKKAG